MTVTIRFGEDRVTLDFERMLFHAPHASVTRTIRITDRGVENYVPLQSHGFEQPIGWVLMAEPFQIAYCNHIAENELLKQESTDEQE